MEPNAILIRYDEIFLKRGLRSYFLDCLDRNLRRALRPFPGVKLRRPHGRFLVQADAPRDSEELPPALADAPRMARAVARVFGVASASLTYVLEPSADTLIERIGGLVDHWLGERQVATFGVRARRADKRFPLSSGDINRKLGARVLASNPGLRVHLDDPDVWIGVEIRTNEVFAYFETLPGPRGLPVGCNGKVLGLLSGGIDSPVALWSIMKRGVGVEAVYFHSFPYTSDAAREKVRELARIVGAWQGGMTLHVVPFTDIQKACWETARPKDLVVLYRRFMLRIAEQIAEDIGAAALVTGESLGQVASQTLANLDAIQRVVTRPVLRPLIAADKMEAVALAREIGTYDVSIEPVDDCCSLFVPRHPELRARPDYLERVESAFDIPALVADAVGRTERIEVT